MIILKKLYTEPSIFTPILFQPGVNLILGEKSEVKKTNGVGKSVCIEFINFCLLKDKSHSRVMLIADDVLPGDTKIKLDLELFGVKLTIERCKNNPEKPVFIFNNETIEFVSSNDAQEFLNDKITRLTKINELVPSFRDLMGILIRDEKCEFQDILNCYDVNKKIPNNLTPHLFLLNIDIALYKETKEIIESLVKSREYLNRTKKSIIALYPNKDLESIRAELNALDDELKKMYSAIEQLKTLDSSESFQNEIVNIESDIDLLKKQQQKLKLQIRKIEDAPKYEEIDPAEIVELYNQFKEGLGSHLKNSLQKTQEFKKKIDDFQSRILTEKLKKFREELFEINTTLRTKEECINEKLSTINHEGMLKNLKNSLAIYNKKSESISKLRSLFVDYDEEEKTKKRLSTDKKIKISEFDLELDNKQDSIKSFEETILNVHNFIMGNKKATFDVRTTDSLKAKEFVDIVMRTDDDGSHSVDRTKVFVYDIALLINEETKKRHPGFLIHDNIFDVDQDTLVKSLNFLDSVSNRNEFQYILTLNRDKIENEEVLKLITLDIDKARIARFTKQERFLNKQYQENKK